MSVKNARPGDAESARRNFLIFVDVYARNVFSRNNKTTSVSKSVIYAKTM